jgi:hypothetical protein
MPFCVIRGNSFDRAAGYHRATECVRKVTNPHPAKLLDLSGLSGATGQLAEFVAVEECLSAWHANRPQGDKMTQPPTLTRVEQLREFHRQWEISWRMSQGGAQPAPDGDKWEDAFRTLARELADK